MTTASGADTAPARADQTSSNTLLQRLLTVAWMAILLGLVFELLFIAVSIGFSGQLGDWKPFVADFVQKVSWSTIVCIGLALGTTAAKARGAVMGLLGLISAPLAFTLARMLHKAAQQLLSIPPGAATQFPVAVALTKAIEYGCLGLALGWIVRQRWGGLAAHAGFGLLAGLVFGGVIVLILQNASQVPPPKLAAQAVNEVLFPVGCSIVLYGAQALGRRTITAGR